VKNRWTTGICVLILLTCKIGLAQQPTTMKLESHKYRTILTLAGAGGGFALGLFGGLAAFDDATNSDRKVWTTAALSGVGGGVAGYFLGRSLDNGRKKTNVTRVSDEFYRRLTIPQKPFPQTSSGLQSQQPILLIGAAKYSHDFGHVYLATALAKMSPSQGQAR